MKRIQSLDLARGFTVLFIPAIHAGMLYSRYEVHTSIPGEFLIAIAEGPGGQLLMLLMGISFTFRQTQNTKQVFKRSIILLITGYLLNILKFVIPYLFGGLPQTVLTKLQVNESNKIFQLTSIGDILHFAAITQLILHGIYKTKYYHLTAAIIATAILLFSPFIQDAHSTIQPLNYLLELFTGQPPHVFFPLFPWLVYPLTGLTIGYYFKRSESQTMQATALIGLILTVNGLYADHFLNTENPAGFYRTPPPATAWHLGIVLITLALWHLLSTKIKSNTLFDILTFSSRHITLIYLIQWIMICWALPIFGYQRLNLTVSLVIMFSMTINTYAITFFIQVLKRYYANN